jgi:hypothetical protein
MAKQANLFELSGDGIQVTYSSSSFQGKPQFNYHDATQAKTFTADQIHSVDTDLGSLVTVVLQNLVDAGSTTFTLVLPRVNLSITDIANINTIGITTLHKMSIIGTPNGQTDFYTVHALQGTAAHVAF